MIGGLVAAAIHENYLFLVTHSGSGIIDINTGIRIARDTKLNYPNNDGFCNGIGPLNGQKIVEVTVLPIQWFALEKSYGLVDIIKNIYKGNRMAPTNAELIKRIIDERFLVIALGAVTFKNVEWNSSLKWWTSTRQQGVLESISS